MLHATGPVGSGSGGNYLADFAEGYIFQYNQTNLAAEPNLYFWNLSGYLQDHWRITPRLTIDAGVRLEHITPWQDSHNQGPCGVYAGGVRGWCERGSAPRRAVAWDQLCDSERPGDRRAGALWSRGLALPGTYTVVAGRWFAAASASTAHTMRITTRQTRMRARWAHGPTRSTVRC